MYRQIAAVNGERAAIGTTRSMLNNRLSSRGVTMPNMWSAIADVLGGSAMRRRFMVSPPTPRSRRRSSLIYRSRTERLVLLNENPTSFPVDDRDSSIVRISNRRASNASRSSLGWSITLNMRAV